MTFTIYRCIVNNLGITKTKMNNNDHYFGRRPTYSFRPSNTYMHIKLILLNEKGRLVHMTQLDVKVNTVDHNFLYYSVM
jgi:hypothetical protein